MLCEAIRRAKWRSGLRWPCARKGMRITSTSVSAFSRVPLKAIMKRRLGCVESDKGYDILKSGDIFTPFTVT